VVVEGGPFAERVLPAGLESGLEVLAHPVGSVRVEAAHAGNLVTQAMLGQVLRDAVFGHPGLVAVPHAVRVQAVLDRKPAGDGDVLGDGAGCPVPAGG
jgi:hypothetical protein